MREAIGLKELLDRIKGTLEEGLPGRLWVKADIGEIKVNSSGHCYLDLIESSQEGGVVAKVAAVIWASSFRVIRPYFETTTGRALERGLTILVNVVVQYSQLYGLSLAIYDIDPTYTVGEQEIKRGKIIAKLKEEGMFGVNSSLTIEPLPREIALISSSGAAGYLDFIKQLEENEYGFKFNVTLFEAPLQGREAPAGIIEAMERAINHPTPFQLLVIARGGGAAQDLVAFDDYNLAINIAQFPLPVITAVGHQHNLHIADMVAHTAQKTPTAAATFIVELFIAEEQQLLSLSRRFSLALRGKFEGERSKIERIKERLKSASQKRFREEEFALSLLERRVMEVSPLETLERGYAILLKGGERVSSIKQLKSGEQLSLLLRDGGALCKIESIHNQKEE